MIAIPLSRAPSLLPVIPAERIVMSLNPSAGTIFDSSPRSVPTKITSQPGILAFSSLAIAMPGKMWPPVPPPATSTVDVPTYAALWLMFSSTPDAVNPATSDDPPYDRNGSGNPLAGSIPSATLMLIIAWITRNIVIPAAR